MIGRTHRNLILIRQKVADELGVKIRDGKVCGFAFYFIHGEFRSGDSQGISVYRQLTATDIMLKEFRNDEDDIDSYVEQISKYIQRMQVMKGL